MPRAGSFPGNVGPGYVFMKVGSLLLFWGVIASLESFANLMIVAYYEGEVFVDNKGRLSRRWG